MSHLFQIVRHTPIISTCIHTQSLIARKIRQKIRDLDCPTARWQEYSISHRRLRPDGFNARQARLLVLGPYATHNIKRASKGACSVVMPASNFPIYDLLDMTRKQVNADCLMSTLHAFLTGKKVSLGGRHFQVRGKPYCMSARSGNYHVRHLWRFCAFNVTEQPSW